MKLDLRVADEIRNSTWFRTFEPTCGIVVAVLLISCNQPFDPRGELDRRPVIFSVLSTDRNAQFVRVERSYMPPGFDPHADTSEKSIVGASVTISGQGTEVRLRDTIFARSDTSRLRSPMRAYVAAPLRPAYGATYRLNVDTRQFENAAATVSVPSKPMITMAVSSIAVLDYPAEHDSSADIIFPISLGTGSTGFSGRCFVDYDVLVGEEWVSSRVEVPTGFAFSGLRSYDYLSYPALSPRPFGGRTSGLFQNQFYKFALSSVAYKDFGRRKVVFNRVVFQLLQVEKNLYSYFMTAHAYRDPHSIRLDEPFSSDIEGVMGVVGAYTLDSLVHPLPDNFTYNRR